MFENVGRIIKVVAKVFTWVGIIVSVVAGLIVMFSNEVTPLPGLFIIITGCLGSWLSMLTLYGFGQLIENTDILVKQNQFFARQGQEDK